MRVVKHTAILNLLGTTALLISVSTAESRTNVVARQSLLHFPSVDRFKVLAV